MANRLKINSLKNEFNHEIKSISDDFLIYPTHKSFKFGARQILKKDTLNFFVILKIIPQKNRKNALVKYTYQYEKIDIEKLNLNQKCNDITDSLCFIELTSISDFDSWCFIHPPRLHTLEILEIAPFPMIIYNSTEWANVLEIPKGSWGEWENTDFVFDYRVDTIKKEKDYTNYYISSKSTSKFGTNTNNFIFNSDSGITKLKYEFEKYGNVELNLLSIKVE